MLWTGRTDVRITTGARYFSFLQNRRTAPGAHPASCLMGTVILSQVQSGRVVNLTTYLHLEPVCRHGVDRDSFNILSIANRE